MAVLLAAAPASALDPATRLTQYGRDAWQVEDGLPQNTIKAIHQTKDGYLWLATEEGVARFDGVRFAVFDSINTPEMTVAAMEGLAEDAEGRLWLATRGGGLLRHADGAFIAFHLPDKPGILSSVALDAGRRVWAGTAAGLVEVRGGSLVSHPGNGTLAAEGVYALLGDRAGTMWIGTRARGVVALKDGQVRRYAAKDGLADDHVWSLAEGADGAIWVGTDGGISRIGIDGTVTNSLPGESVRALLEDRAGTLWAGTNEGGLVRLRRGATERLRSAQGLSSASVASLFEDREGSLWIGTNGGGLNRLRDGAVTTVGVEEGLSGDQVRAVFQHPDGTVWVGTKGGGATALRDGMATPLTVAAGLSADTVISFAAGRDGALWLGTVRDGLNRYHRGRVTVFRPAQGLPHESAFALLARADGSLWIGHRGGGLTRFLDGRFTSFGAKEGLHSSYVWTLAEGREGALWLGTNGGVYSFDGAAFRRFAPGVAAHAIHVDGDGVVWAGTATQGLLRIKEGQVAAVTRGQGLFDNTVEGVLEDGRGRLWMSCNKGIFSVAKAALHAVADGRAARVESVSYDASDGMRSRECSYGSSAKTSDGRLWFPTIRGVAVIDPGNLKRNAVPPPLAVEQVLGDGRPLKPSGAATLEMPPGDGRLQIHYTALSLAAPRKVRFAYRLEGLDGGWTDAGALRQVSYANLRPGGYTFRVKAANNDGVWNEDGAAVRIELQPHFHQTPWFLALCAGAIGLVAWEAHRIRVRRLLAVERVRTRIAADLHDDVGSGLSQIAVLTGVARAEIGRAGASAPDALGVIARTAEELVDSMSDIVWAMNPGKDRLGDVVHRMRRFATEALSAREIAFTFTTSGVDEALSVGPDFRRHAYLIFKEAVSNAARHSGASRVELAVAAAGGRLGLRVQDDGRGIDPAAPADGHGLVTLRSRAKELGGTIAIGPRPGGGTAIVADLPLAR